MSAIFDPMKDPVNNHSTKARPAAAGSLLEGFFNLQTCHKSQLGYCRPRRDSPKPLL